MRRHVYPKAGRSSRRDSRPRGQGHSGAVAACGREQPNRIDYAQLVKIYGKSNFRSAAPDTRYSPAPIIGVRVHPIFGKPDRDRINTSYIERFNLDVRMKCRRMTRLTNAFSKSWNHHVAAIALLMAWHNFCRIHGSTKTTPVVAAGIAEKPWSIRELLERAAERV